MQVNPYLHFHGNCEEAFQFYARVLGGTIAALHRFAGSPMESQTPPDWRNKVMHASLRLGAFTLLGSDPPAPHFQAPQGFSVCLEADTEAEADRMFAALAEGGKPTMPIQKTFWSRRFGMLVDRFGIPWIVNCPNPEYSS